MTLRRLTSQLTGLPKASPVDWRVRPRWEKCSEGNHYFDEALPGMGGQEDWTEGEYGLAVDGTSDCSCSAVAVNAASDFLSALYSYPV